MHDLVVVIRRKAQVSWGLPRGFEKCLLRRSFLWNQRFTVHISTAKVPKKAHVRNTCSTLLGLVFPKLMWVWNSFSPHCLISYRTDIPWSHSGNTDVKFTICNYYYYFFGLTTQNVGSYFSDLGLNLCLLARKSASLNPWTTREFPLSGIDLQWPYI